MGDASGDDNICKNSVEAVYICQVQQYYPKCIKHVQNIHNTVANA